MKIIKVKSCERCPNHRVDAEYAWCHLNGMQNKLRVEDDIPEWCPLDDDCTAPANDDMELNDALREMWRSGIKTLDIHWMEINEVGDDTWWCDIVNDELNKLCATNWSWTALSEVESKNADWCGLRASWMLICDGTYTDDLVCDTVRTWLRDHGHEFDVEVKFPDIGA